MPAAMLEPATAHPTLATFKTGQPQVIVKNNELPEWITPAQFFSSINYVTLKVTNGCNLKCSYCNVEADHPSTPRLSMEMFKHIADLYIPNTKSPYGGLEFHGGEPLLLSDEWYTEAVGYAQALAKKHKKHIEHPMQTNGTLLDEKRQKHLLDLGIHIGFSFDGTPEINDIYRMAGSKVEATIKRMIKDDKDFGMILVLSRSNHNKMTEIMNYFQKLGIRSYRINPVQPQGWGLDSSLLTAEELTTGMIAVFNHMADTDCSVIEAETMQAVHRMVEGRLDKPPLSCWELECQAGRSYCAVSVKGEVYACGTDMSKHRLGNIYENFNLENISSVRKKLHQKDAWYVRCFGCEAKRICHFSCPTSDFNDIRYRDIACAHTKSIYSYMAENFDKVEKIQRAIKKRIKGPSMR